MATLERFGPTGHDLVMLDEARGRVSVGTSAHNDLVIDGDPAVSRVHAVLEHVGPAWCITDVGSSNGTTVNGDRLFGPRLLSDRDEVVMGRTPPGRARRRGARRRHHGAAAAATGADTG